MDAIRDLTVAALLALPLGSCAPPPALSLTDAGGATHEPFAADHAKATVLVFMSTDCPIANSYQPELERIRARFAPLGVEIYGVYPEFQVTQDEVATHARDYSIRYSQVIDSDWALAKACDAHVTPEVFVLVPEPARTGAAAGGSPGSRGAAAAPAPAHPFAGTTLVYRGRIDDWYPQRGSRRAAPGTHDLVSALEAVTSGASPPVTTTEPVGCVFRTQ